MDQLFRLVRDNKTSQLNSGSKITLNKIYLFYQTLQMVQLLLYSSIEDFSSLTIRKMTAAVIKHKTRMRNTTMSMPAFLNNASEYLIMSWMMICISSDSCDHSKIFSSSNTWFYQSSSFIEALADCIDLDQNTAGNSTASSQFHHQQILFMGLSSCGQ